MITLQRLSFGQLVLGPVAYRLHHRNSLGITLGHCNSYRRVEWFPYHNFWRIGPLGELMLSAVMWFLHLRNRKRTNCVIVSGPMVHQKAWTFCCPKSSRRPNKGRGTFDHHKGQKSAVSLCLHLNFLNFVQWILFIIFFFSPASFFPINRSQKPLQHPETLVKILGRESALNPVTSLAIMACSAPNGGKEGLANDIGLLSSYWGQVLGFSGLKMAKAFAALRSKLVFLLVCTKSMRLDHATLNSDLEKGVFWKRVFQKWTTPRLWKTKKNPTTFWRVSIIWEISESPPVKRSIS